MQSSGWKVTELNLVTGEIGKIEIKRLEDNGMSSLAYFYVKPDDLLGLRIGDEFIVKASPQAVTIESARRPELVSGE